MRVIYMPKDEKEIECPNCGSILGYNEYDIYNGYDGIFLYNRLFICRKISK